MSFTSEDPDIASVVAAELRLMDRAVRNSRAESAALLDPEFREFASSGRVWDRESILDAMSSDRSMAPITDNITAMRLAPNVIQLTYRTRSPERTTVRSSIWLLRDGTWKLYFHQGTPQASDNNPA
ncbi:nuclear transport factor 2 family protein [Nocardia sp. NPDC005978]|uniref:nuclear transport factor 2 family protein n=1 Tax=Nocardia sp. NPDC005978 TaxID=3156725 RepID=UPI00339FDDC6